MKALGKITFFCISILFGALLSAWILSKLWLWFVAAQYGHGPSLGAWYGLALIGRSALHRADATSNEKGNDKDFGDLALETVSLWVGYLIVLGLAWVTGAVIGWIP